MWFKKPNAPKTHQTPFGEFIQKNRSWEGYIETPDEEVRIITDDVNGEPNPRLLHVIPLIQQKLSHFEAITRDAVEPLSSHYYLESVDISSVHPETDFSLIFVRSDEICSGAINVEFKDEKVAGWWSTD